MEQDFERLDAFGQSLAKTRSEAIAARETSGIEDIWLEDEEFYEGIDEMNRGDEKEVYRQKPPGRAGVRSSNNQTRSTVFPNITGPFVDAFSARIADMLLPTDDRNFAIKPTPIPELSAIAKGEVPRDIQRSLDEQYPIPEQADQAEKQMVLQAREEVDLANKKAEKAQQRIDDWHVECQYHAHVRSVIEDVSRIGTGILKGPVPIQKRTVVWNAEQRALDIKITLNPGSKWVDPWNFYPDGACGENIHNGGYTWERDYITKKQLRELGEEEGYIPEQIDLCLKEGPIQVSSVYKETPDPVNDPAMKNRYEIWYYHGIAESEDIKAAGCECEEEAHISVMITMVNNRVIRVSENPLDTGDFPYDVMICRRRSGHWTGIGVARQIRVAQKIVTGATRNLMDNAGLAAGPMVVLKQGVVYPADNIPGIAPRKIFYIAKDDDTIADADKAIGQIKIDMMVNELMVIVNFGLQLAEQTTSMPMILQGQMGRSVPDTLGGQQLFMNNASTVLRRMARLFDDRITEPHVRRYYTWLLQYGEDNNEKGDYVIDARGSSALVEREIQNQELLQMANLMLDPRFGKDPKKWMEEYLKSRHFDPKRFDYDDDQWQQIVENLSGPQDPRVAIAEMKTQSDEMNRQHQEKLKGMEQQFEAMENDKDRQLDLVLKQMDAEIDSMKQTGDKEINFENIKKALAETVIKVKQDQRKLDTQVQLSSMKTKPAEEVATPSMEPPGRAQPGRAFQQ